LLATHEDSSDDGNVLQRWPLAAQQLPVVARSAAAALVGAIAARAGESVATHAERLRAAIAPLVEAAYQDSGARLADLDVLVAASAKVSRLSDVAADHVLDPPRSTSALAGPPSVDEDWLVISTVHSAKGLEWDVVHLLHVTDGNIPSDMALGVSTGLEEERRVLYVALTRARNALHLYVPERYHHHPRARDDRHSWAQPSRFLSDGVRAHCDEVAEQGDQPAVMVSGLRVDTPDRVSMALDELWS
jgi:DNA helicase-2/ATP-dependent DNA helicase PcrA